MAAGDAWQVQRVPHLALHLLLLLGFMTAEVFWAPTW
jgi:hypothetical protein